MTVNLRISLDKTSKAQATKVNTEKLDFFKIKNICASKKKKKKSVELVLHWQMSMCLYTFNLNFTSSTILIIFSNLLPNHQTGWYWITKLLSYAHKLLAEH